MNVNMLENAKNYIEKLWIADSKLFLEGLAYIEGYDSPNHTSLIKKLKLKRHHAAIELEFPLGMVPKYHLAKQEYQGQEYNYTAAGTATVGFKGIDLSKLDNGLYEIQLSVSPNNTLYYKDLILHSSMSDLDKHSSDDYFEYRLFQKYGKIYLAKRDILGRDVSSTSYFNITNQWVKDTVFHVEGEFLVAGADITEFTQAKYYLIAQKPLTQRQYVFELGQIKKPNLGTKIGNPFGGYDACYFATWHLKGIDTTAFELGLYDLYISLAYKSEIFTAKLNMNLEINQNGERNLINL